MKQRLHYLDAARGLAIFTVVYSHICLFCLPNYNSSAVIDFLRSYFLNAFFFISGFVAYKSPSELKGRLAASFFRKIWQLLIPTVVVGTVYALTQHIDIVKFYTDEAKYGYWFTFVLFEMYAVYYLISRISSTFHSQETTEVILFAALAIGFYIIHKSVMINTPLQKILCMGSLCYYMPFFCIGLLCRKFKALIIIELKIGGGFLLRYYLL